MQDQYPHYRAETIGNLPRETGSASYATAKDIDNRMSLPGAGGGLPWFGGNNPHPVTPYQPTVPQNPPTTQTSGNGLNLPGGLSLADLLALLVSGKQAFSGGGSNQTGSGNPALDAQLAEMLRTQQGRVTKSEPLYDAILSMAGGLMPVQYQPKTGQQG